MSQTTMRVPVTTVRAFVKDVFISLGVPEKEAQICEDVLVSSDLRGIDSHGIGRLFMYHERIREGVQHARTQFEVVKETETTATVDGHHGMGHVIAHRSMEMAIEKAHRYGLGAVAVRNSTHYGFAGYYPIMATRHEMMGLTVTNARPSVPPTFSSEPMLGTNPITFAAPSDLPFPFVIDAATSISQRGKIEHLERIGKKTPDGWAIHPNGQAHTETSRLLNDLLSGKAALLPLGGVDERLGGHKGYGYATMVEILSAALSGGSFMKDLMGFTDEGVRSPYRLGHFFLAVDLAHFIDPAVSRAITGSIMRGLQEARKLPGYDRIYVAGEKEYEEEQRRLKEGIPVSATLRARLNGIAEDLQLTQYRF